MPTEEMRKRLAVTTERLRRTCDPVEPGVAPDPSAIIGQADALASVEFGLKMSGGHYAKSHYNIIVTGPPNTGRTTKTIEYVRGFARGIAASPPDLVVLPDFADQHRPVLCRVPNGAGAAARKMLADLGMYAIGVLPKMVAIFRENLLQKAQKKGGEIWEKSGEEIRACGFMVIQVEDGRYVIAPRSLADPDRPMSPEEGARLREEDEEAHDRLVGEMKERANAIFEKTIKETDGIAAAFAMKSTVNAMKLAEAAFDKQIKDLRALIGENETFDAYVNGLKMLAIGFSLREPESADEGEASAGCGRHPDEENMAEIIRRMTTLNVQVDNAGATNPPVVYVKSPKWSILFGKTEPEAVSRDSIKFDHTMVECGEFLRADGGFLVLDLDDLLRDGGVATLYKLLHVIRTRRMKVESKAQFYDYQSLLEFQSKEIETDVRVVAICDRRLARVLRAYIQEFDNLFRIDAQFDDEMPFEEAPAAYSAFIGICRQQEGLREFSPEAVARLVEHGARRARDRRKASTEFGVLKDVIAEADFLARESGAETVGPEHVRRAVRNRFDRSALWVRKYREYLDDSVLLDCDGAKIGQINALVVLGAHQEIAIGAPSRITGRAYKGDGKVILVQREVDTSGPSSNTAVQTITGWLHGLFGKDAEMGLGVQLSFEQCYGGVEGDSASLAEAVVIMSVLTDLPIDQRMAITGSMNQLGEAQPIGGENEKIEGHFDWLVRKNALKPGCGVALPMRNLDGLMLKEEVIKAQEQGLYQVYSIEKVEDALELFLGRPADEIYAIAREKLNASGKPSIFRKIVKFFKKMFRR